MTTQAKTGGARPQAKGRQEPPDLAGEPTAWCLGRGTALRLGPPILCQHRWALGISPPAGGGEPKKRGLRWALELGTKERAVPPLPAVLCGCQTHCPRADQLIRLDSPPPFLTTMEERPTWLCLASNCSAWEATMYLGEAGAEGYRVGAGGGRAPDPSVCAPGRCPSQQGRLSDSGPSLAANTGGGRSQCGGHNPPGQVTRMEGLAEPVGWAAVGGPGEEHRPEVALSALPECPDWARCPFQMGLEAPSLVWPAPAAAPSPPGGPGQSPANTGQRG